MIAGNIKEGSSFAGGRKPADAQKRQRTKLNLAFKFGPPRGDSPRFRLTVAVPDLRVGCPVRSSCFPSPNENYYSANPNPANLPS